MTGRSNMRHMAGKEQEMTPEQEYERAIEQNMNLLRENQILRAELEIERLRADYFGESTIDLKRTIIEMVDGVVDEITMNELKADLEMTEWLMEVGR